MTEEILDALENVAGILEDNSDHRLWNRRDGTTLKEVINDVIKKLGNGSKKPYWVDNE